MNSHFPKGMATSSQTILIVDDIPPNIGLLYASLHEAGYQIYAATSGMQALHIASEVTLDLILLDIMMPGMDGFETCRRLKAEQSTKSIPVIFITATNNAEDVAKSFSVGAADYLSKPIRVEELLIRVEMQLKKNLCMLKQREQEEKLNVIINNMSEGVVLIDSQGQITFSNPACNEELGLTKDEIIGQAFTALLSERQRDNYRGFFSKAPLQNSPSMDCGPREVGVLDRSGKSVNMDLTLASVFLEERHYIGLLRNRQAHLSTPASPTMTNSNSLANLANRPHFLEVIEQHWQYCLAMGIPVTLLLLSVDGLEQSTQFRQFVQRAEPDPNAGILQTLVTKLTDLAINANGLAAQMEKHHFALLLPDLENYKAVNLANNLLDSLSSSLRHVTAAYEAPAKLPSFSISLTTHTPLSLQEMEKFLEFSEVQLRTARKQGKNKILSTHF